MLISELPIAASGSGPLITLLAAILGGGVVTAVAQVVISRRVESRQGKKDSMDIARDLYTAQEQRDSLIGEAADRAVAFMKTSLEEAERQLHDAQTAIGDLNAKIAELQIAAAQAEGQRQELRESLNLALRERAEFEAQAKQLEERVHELEVRVGARREDDPPVGGT